MKFGYFVEVILKKVACRINVHVEFLCILDIQQNKNTNPTFRTLLPYETLLLQSITKIQFKDREQPPVEMNYTDLDKVLSELFRPLVKNYLLLFLVVFSSFKVIPSLQKIDYQL